MTDKTKAGDTFPCEVTSYATFGKVFHELCRDIDIECGHLYEMARAAITLGNGALAQRLDDIYRNLQDIKTELENAWSGAVNHEYNRTTREVGSAMGQMLEIALKSNRNDSQ